MDEIEAEMYVSMKMPVTYGLVAEWMNFLKLNEAANFMTMKAVSKDGEEFALTIQRVGGKTPTELIGELTAELARLKGEE